MTEDEIIEVPASPAPEPVPEPEPPVPTPDLPAPTPEPLPPVEVVTVEDLLDRLTQTAVPAPSETPLPEPTPPSETEPVVFVDPGPTEILGMDVLLEHIEVIEQTMTAPAMTKSFEEYTVTEALLLLVFVLAVVSACIKLLKGGFSWLLW